MAFAHGVKRVTFEVLEDLIRKDVIEGCIGIAQAEEVLFGIVCVDYLRRLQPEQLPKLARLGNRQHTWTNPVGHLRSQCLHMCIQRESGDVRACRKGLVCYAPYPVADEAVGVAEGRDITNHLAPSNSRR